MDPNSTTSRLHTNPQKHNPSNCLSSLAHTFTNRLSKIAFHYLAEGNANVIYALSSDPPQPPHPLDPPTTPNPDVEEHVDCVVLRLRKDLPFTKPSIEVVSAFRERIMPLFSPDFEDVLMPQLLLPLNDRIIDMLNSMLDYIEDDEITNGRFARPIARRGVFHPMGNAEPHGILMPNLHALGGRLLEFKPKWLVQSPSAPGDARRCRTCAVNLLRRVKGKHKGRGDSGFCPFALLRREDKGLEAALEQIDGDGAGKRLMGDFVEKVQPALKHLQGLQKRFGEVGLEDFQSQEEKDFGVAMALRDCSVFLVVSEGDEKPQILDVKFADLDLKTTEGGKIQRWAEIEEELILRGMYTDDVDGDESPLCFWPKDKS